MPPYPGNGLAKLLYENKQEFLFFQEALVVGTPSKGVQLRRERGNFYPFGASFELFFSADPGVFAVDLQVADTDLDSHYISVATLDSVNGSFVTRFDMTNLYPKYVRALPTAIANAVLANLQVTR